MNERIGKTGDWVYAREDFWSTVPPDPEPDGRWICPDCLTVEELKTMRASLKAAKEEGERP